MRKIGLWMLLALGCLTACSDKGEKAAAMHLQKAEVALQQENFSEAKLQIDTIKLLYPKAFEVRKKGIKLMQQIDLKEQQRNLAYLDSTMQVKQLQLDSIRSEFVLEKDTAYQEIGNYFHPSQVVEKNLSRCFLRAQVSEQGVMTLTSIYHGGHNLHHVAVKVSVGDSFAETPSSKDSYESSQLGQKTEKADYLLGEDGGVIDFIVTNADKNIKVQFLGDKNYRTTMQSNDKKAFVAVRHLATILSSMEQIRKEQKEAELKINFVTRKIEEKKSAE